MLKPYLLLLLCFFLSDAFSNPLILTDEGSYHVAPYISYIIEDKESLGIEGILNSSLDWKQNTTNNLNFGFNQKPIWLKFSVENHNVINQDWALELSYPAIDNIDVYIINSHKQVISYFYGGDQVASSEKIIQHPNIVFPLDLFPYDDITIYARIESDGSIQIPLTIWKWDSFNFHTLVHFILQGIFYGMVLIMAIYNLVVWITEKERVYLTYVTYILVFTIFQLSLHGIGYQFIWPELPSLNKYLTPTSMALICLTLFMFIEEFFQIKKLNKTLSKINKIGIYFSGVIFIICIIFPYHISIFIVTLYVLYSVGIVIFTMFYMLKIHHPSARFFALGWASFFIGALFILGNKLGLIPFTSLTEYGVQLGAGVEIMFLSLALADRMGNEKKEKIQAQQQSLKLAYQVNQEKERSFNAEIENLRIEREHNQKLETLVSLRTQELQTTLEELSQVNEKLQAISITDALTGLNNRYFFNEQWTKEHKRAHRDESVLSLILLDIDYFKKVNDKYGHPAGDLCLQHVANSIARHASRDGDVVCRYGGEEFAIILPNTDESGAADVAEKIRLDIQGLHLRWENKPFSVTASLGITSLQPKRSDEKNQQFMINQADQALYQAKAQGRNQVVFFQDNTQ